MNSIELICFPGAPNLPIFVAREKNFFADAGVSVNLTTTPSSAYQAENLANGKFQIAGTAFDNVVAYREGQGAVALPERPDFIAFMGATQIELALIVAKDVRSFLDLKGRSLALDALSTGFAFVLHEMLRQHGLADGDVTIAPVGATPQRWELVRDGTHAGTLAIEPFTSIARAQGFNVLQTSTDLFDCYQGGIFAASRAWAAARPDSVKGFIRGYITGLDWVLTPANREEAASILLSNMDAIKPPVVDAVMASLLSARSGLTPRAALLDEGLRTVLALRGRYTGAASLTDPAPYIDLTYYNTL